ncbi:MAG: plasmid stabilization protein [Spirochaetes bacterium]|nr:MAG: plasmid stabilization protein [Spirochaetota bacterium]
MYKIIITGSYEKKAVKFFKKHPELKSRYGKTLRIMENNIYHPSLRFHAVGKFQSISINMKYRITIDFVVQDTKIFLIDIGDHDTVYR